MDFPSREELFFNDHKGDIPSMTTWLGVDRHFVFLLFCFGPCPLLFSCYLCSLFFALLLFVPLVVALLLSFVLRT
jgi:hypothetical protein